MTPARRTVLFINLGHTFDHLVMLVFPTAVLGMGGAFGLGYGELLGLAFGAFLAFGLGSLPSGWLGDLWSRRGMMAVFFFGTGAASILVGFSTTPFQLAASMTLLGLFASIYHPVGTAMLVANADRLGSAIGINAIYGNVGIAFSALIAGYFTANFGWRWAFFIPGGIGIALGIAFLASVPRAAGLAKAAAKKAVPPVSRRLALRAFGVLAVATVATGLATNVLLIGVPKLFELRLAEFAGSLERVGLVVTGVLLAGSVAQFIVGRAIDRFGLRAAFVPLTFVLFPALGLLAFAEGPLLIAFAAAAVFGAMGQVTINDTMVARYTVEEFRARAYALRYVVSFGTSAAAVPLVALSFGRTGEFTILFAGLGLLTVLVAIASFFTPRESEVPSTATRAPEPEPEPTGAIAPAE